MKSNEERNGNVIQESHQGAPFSNCRGDTEEDNRVLEHPAEHCLRVINVVY